MRTQTTKTTTKKPVTKIRKAAGFDKAAFKKFVGPLLKQGMTYTEITKRANKAGIKPELAKSWSLQNFSRVKNEVFGKAKH